MPPPAGCLGSTSQLTADGQVPRMPRSIRRGREGRQNLMPCSLTLPGINFRNLHEICSTFLQKLFDTLLQHHMMMMLLLIFYVHLPLNLNAAVPHWCSHTIEPNVATRFPSKLRELVQVAAAHECARCRQTVRQSARTTFNCFHCAQLGGKQATGTTATPSSANPLPTWKVVH